MPQQSFTCQFINYTNSKTNFFFGKFTFSTVLTLYSNHCHCRQEKIIKRTLISLKISKHIHHSQTVNVHVPISLTVSDWCGLPFLCPSWGWARLCDTGRDRGEETTVTGWCGLSCRVTGRWLGADRWSTAACWRSRWPAGCTSELWRALCCSRGNNSSLEDGKKRREKEGEWKVSLQLKQGVAYWHLFVSQNSLDYAIILPLSFPPVKAPLKVPPPAASPSGISSRFIKALGRGCRYTLNTWPPSLSSPGLVSTNTSSNRNTCSRWRGTSDQEKCANSWHSF